MRLSAPPEMQHSIRLVDDTFSWVENGMEVSINVKILTCAARTV